MNERKDNTATQEEELMRLRAENEALHEELEHLRRENERLRSALRRSQATQS